MIQDKHLSRDKLTNTVSMIQYDLYMTTVRDLMKLAASDKVHGFKRLSYQDKSAEISFRCSIYDFKEYMGGKTPYQVNDALKMGKILRFVNIVFDEKTMGQLVIVNIQL